MEDQTMLTKKELKELKRQNKKDEHARQLRSRKLKKYLTRTFVIFTIVIAVVGIWKLSQQSTNSSISSADILQMQSGDWTKGNPNAPVTLVEYLDFECEACGAYYPLVKRLSEEYGEDILFISRYFPLPGHKNAMTSALAIESAGRQGKYWEMHDLIFEEQIKWGERTSADSTIFEEYAKRLNLDMDRFNKDVNSNEVNDRVLRDRNSGNRLGVNGTPAFFLNGKKIQNPRGYEAFKSLLDKALQQ